MKYKARYFLIGGQEPQEEPEEIKVESQEDIINGFDQIDEDTIDRIIDYIRQTNFDPNYSKGVTELGKREYLKKVFTILENEPQPVFPVMEGGELTDDQRKAITKKQEIVSEFEDEIVDVVNTLYKEGFYTLQVLF